MKAGTVRPKNRGRYKPNTSRSYERAIETTFSVYGHLLPGSHDEVRERMDAYLAAGCRTLAQSPQAA